MKNVIIIDKYCPLGVIWHYKTDIILKKIQEIHGITGVFGTQISMIFLQNNFCQWKLKGKSTLSSCNLAWENNHTFSHKSFLCKI